MGKHGIDSRAEINAETSTLTIKQSWRCLMSMQILLVTRVQESKIVWNNSKRLFNKYKVEF